MRNSGQSSMIVNEALLLRVLIIVVCFSGAAIAQANKIKSEFHQGYENTLNVPFSESYYFNSTRLNVAALRDAEELAGHIFGDHLDERILNLGVNFVKIFTKWPCIAGMYPIGTWETEGDMRYRYTCGIHAIHGAPIVYSFGSNKEQEFELALLKLRPDAKIFIFDLNPDLLPPMDKRHPQITYTGAGIGYYHSPYCEDSNCTSMQDIMVHYGHKYVDVLKFDIGGWEYAWLKEESGVVGPRVGQLLLTLHDRNDFDVMPVVTEYFYTYNAFTFNERMENDCYLRCFHQNANLQHVRSIADVGFINANWISWNLYKKYEFTALMPRLELEYGLETHFLHNKRKEGEGNLTGAEINNNFLARHTIQTADAMTSWKSPACRNFYNLQNNGSLFAMEDLNEEGRVKAVHLKNTKVSKSARDSKVLSQEVVLSKKYRLGYVSNRKAASTLVLKLFSTLDKQAGYDWCNCETAKSRCMAFGRCTTIDLLPEHMDYFFFTFVRDPYGRFYAGLSMAHWMWGTTDMSTISEDAAFSNLKRHGSRHTAADVHLQTQTGSLSSPTIDGLVVPYGFIGKVENFTEEYAILSQLVQQKLQITLPAPEWSHHTEEDQYLEHIKKFSGSQSLKTLIKETYTQDFVCFGYST